MMPRFPDMGFCIGTGYTGRKCRRNFGGRSWEEDVGGIEGLQGGMMALSGLYSVSIGAGYWRGKIGRTCGRFFSFFFIFHFYNQTNFLRSGN